MGKHETQPTDRLLASAVRQHKNLECYANSGYEHRIFHRGLERSGSLWITPQKAKYRLQTTGMAQSIDRFIEREIGPSVGSQKSNEYKFWYTRDSHTIELIIAEFAKL